MLRPQDSLDQEVLAETLTIDPAPQPLHWTRDDFDNHLGLARFDQPAGALRFDYSVSIRQSPAGLERPFAGDPLPAAADRDHPAYLDRPYDDRVAVARYARDLLGPFLPAAPDIVRLIAEAIPRDFSYVRRAAKGIQAPAETIAIRSGTCRDFAVLAIDLLRSLGLPARFVSGYLYVPARDRLDVRGGGATHAWVQVLLPGAGWVDVDPTNGIVGNAGLIRVAVVADPSQAVPLAGTYAGTGEESLGMTVSVKVTRDRRAEASS